MTASGHRATATRKIWSSAQCASHLRCVTTAPLSLQSPGSRSSSSASRSSIGRPPDGRRASTYQLDELTQRTGRELRRVAPIQRDAITERLSEEQRARVRERQARTRGREHAQARQRKACSYAIRTPCSLDRAAEWPDDQPCTELSTSPWAGYRTSMKVRREAGAGRGGYRLAWSPSVIGRT